MVFNFFWIYVFFYIFEVEEAKCQNTEFEGNLEVSEFNLSYLDLNSMVIGDEAYPKFELL